MVIKFEATIKQFFQRILYKLSGQKIMGFIISAGSIILIVVFAKTWTHVSDALYMHAITAIKTIAIALLAVRGVQNAASIASDYMRAKNGNNMEDK